MEALGALDVVEVLKDKMVVDMHEEIKRLKKERRLEISMPHQSSHVVAHGQFLEDAWSPPHLWSRWGGEVPEPDKVYEEKELIVDLTTVDDTLVWVDEYHDEPVLEFDIRTNGILFCRATGEFTFGQEGQNLAVDCYTGTGHAYYPTDGTTVVVGTLHLDILSCGKIRFNHLCLIERWARDRGEHEHDVS
jgi:hypothetical protein